ncbi:MAG: P-loop NTPase [Candidatus Woesearchaeota archaeon]
MKSIVVLSGKGGVGKSSISASLAVSFSKDKKIICADCDVDASNLSLLFSLYEKDYENWSPLSTNQIAAIDKYKCIKCKKCIDTCYFDAIFSRNGYPSVNEFGCEGCCACEMICPAKAISMKNIDNAFIGHAKSGHGFYIVSAQLLPGFSGSGKVVSRVRQKSEAIGKNADYMLIDAAAGTGCPVIASVAGNDFALLVTEPTPSGLSDLKKALKVVDHFKINKGLIINKYDLNQDYAEKIENFAKDKNINILKRINFDKNIISAMNKMIPVIDFDKKYEKVFMDIKNKIMLEIKK